MPKNLWHEAVRWTIHILNRSFTLVVKDMTSEEAWSGEKPSVDYFIDFGCVRHVHISGVNRRKLKNKSVKCALFGVSREFKDYRIFNPATNKIIISHN